MEPIVGGVFINYRSDDSRSMSELLDRDLAAAFGRERVFLDCYSIPLGADFVQELIGRVEACQVLLVVIDRDWLTLTDSAGRRRLDDPADWIHREIATAFAAGARVVPVLIDGTVVPAEDQLPADIRALGRCQGARVRRKHTRFDIAALIHRLGEIEPALMPEPGATPSGQAVTMTANSFGRGRVYQAGRDQHVTEA